MTFRALTASAAIAIAVSGTLSSASAQEEDSFFVRNKYVAVTERPQPEFDPVTVRLGTFEAKPELGLGAGFASNLFAVDENETDDTFFSVAPKVEVNSTWGRHALGAEAVVDHLEYTDTSDESRTNLIGRVFGRLDVSQNVNVFGGVRGADLVEPRSNIASLANAADPVDYSEVGADVGVEYTAARLRLRGRVELQELDYDDVSLTNGLIQDQDFRDREDTTIEARVSYAIERDWAVFGEVQQIESDYDPANMFNAFNRDSSGTIVRAGTDFELQSLIRGDIAVGFLSYDYDDAAFEDVDGLSVEANAQWFVTQLTTITGSAERSVVDPGLQATNSAVLTGVAIRADHELRRNILLYGGVDFSQFDFENVNRTDDRYGLEVGGTWKLNRNVWVDASYRLLDQSSNVQEFTDNRLMIGLKFFP
ncbi:MAG: outer membrane beta-barrel protein [Henriciella sp.]|nr:outer membrane beta-barrel protein [Henriciella sp.]